LVAVSIYPNVPSVSREHRQSNLYPAYLTPIFTPSVFVLFTIHYSLFTFSMSTLFPILDSALASAATRSAHWLACKPGCHQCCVGVFPVSLFDAENLRTALHDLEKTDPARAAAIRTRAHASRTRLTPNFPGNASTGQLFTHPDHEEAFEDFANDEPFPVLDPTTGTCDLYAARPIPCRTFGPPLRNEEGALAVCELCFINAPAEEVARCEMDQSWRDQEAALIEQTEQSTNTQGPTLIAFALTQPTRP
jgi:Fe-S-cluster containining protein